MNKFSGRDGGPAFPRSENATAEGMSLLDWFAGQALSGLLPTLSEEHDWSAEDVAESAYTVAEAMVKEGKDHT